MTNTPKQNTSTFSVSQDTEEIIFRWAHEKDIRLHSDVFEPLIKALAQRERQAKRALIEEILKLPQFKLINDDGDKVWCINIKNIESLKKDLE